MPLTSDHVHRREKKDKTKKEKKDKKEKKKKHHHDDSSGSEDKHKKKARLHASSPSIPFLPKAASGLPKCSRLGMDASY